MRKILFSIFLFFSFFLLFSKSTYATTFCAGAVTCNTGPKFCSPAGCLDGQSGCTCKAPTTTIYCGWQLGNLCGANAVNQICYDGISNGCYTYSDSPTPPPAGGNTCQGSCFDGSAGQNCGTYGQAGKSGTCSTGQICCGSTGIGSCGLEGHCGGWAPFGGINPTDSAAAAAEVPLGHCGYSNNGAINDTSGQICNAYCKGISGVGCDVDNNWGSSVSPRQWVSSGLFEVLPGGGTKLWSSWVDNQGSWPSACGSPKDNPVSGFSSGFNNIQFPAALKDGTAHTLEVLNFDPDGDPGGWFGPTYNNQPLGGMPNPNPFVATCPPGPWWQVTGGDVVTNADLVSSVAPPPVNTNPYFILNSAAGGFPGVAIYGGSHDFAAGIATDPPSAKKWGANSNYNGKTYDSTYFNSLIPSDVTFTTVSGSVNGGTFASGGNPSHGFVWYKADGDLTINSSINLGNRKAILLVNNGDLNIQGRINLNKGQGFFLAIVGKNSNGNKGNIIIDPGVDSKSGGAGPALEGLFMADNQIKTGSSSNQLYIRGTLVALGGVVFQRDMLLSNGTTPGELVDYAPDLVFSFPRDFVKGQVSWREVSP